MIKLVQGADDGEYRDLKSKMFKLRAEVFGTRLGWDVTVNNGQEVDQFDAASPLYLISVGAYGQLNGSLRLLPTTGLNMLSNVFPQLLDQNEIINSPFIWESTRFCVSKAAAMERSPNKLNYTTAELLAGIVEVGQIAGLQSVASVYDARMKRVLRNAGCPATEIGTPTKIGGVTTYAGLFAIDDDMLDRIRVASGITGSVLEKNEVFEAMAA